MIHKLYVKLGALLLRNGNLSYVLWVEKDFYSSTLRSIPGGLMDDESKWRTYFCPYLRMLV
jgi:hypothetical protein